MGYGRVGQDTLAAIAEELQAAAVEGLALPEPLHALTPAASSPEIAIHETLAGRETLAAIAQELRTPARSPMSTLRYGDRISNAPGSHHAARSRSGSPPDTAPEISITSTGVGRETLAAINEDLLDQRVDEPITSVRERPSPERDAPSSSVQSAHTIEVFEMMTFVARGEVSELASTTARRAFVEERLLHRLPAANMDEVDRIDVTPWTVKGTVIVRVWCIVPPPVAKSSRRASG